MANGRSSEALSFVVAELKAKLSTFTFQLKAGHHKFSEEREAFLLDQVAQLKKAFDKAKLLSKQAFWRKALSCRRPF